MERRSAKRVDQRERPKETKRTNATDRETKRHKSMESRKKKKPSPEQTNTEARSYEEQGGLSLSRGVSPRLSRPPPPSPRRPTSHDDAVDVSSSRTGTTPPGEMERGSRKTTEPKSGDQRGATAGGSSADDMRSEFRKMAESSGLQGILKSFGRVDELFGGQSTGKRLKEIVENLNSQDVTKIRVATDDLNNLLNNTAEDAYSTFPIDQIMPALVRCMSFDEDFDVTLKAIRCLGTFARSLPSSCNSMVNHGAIPALCTRLLSIEVIDVAEESIRAIKYIAREKPEACLTNGALYAVLSYLDFFSHHEQRDAVESAAHMCRGLKPENCGCVIDQVPTLVNLLGYEDAVLVEKAAQALLCICEAAVLNPEVLQVLSETQLVGKALDLISGASVSPIKTSTFFGLVKILTLCAGNHPHIAELLLKSSISEVLLNIFSTCASGWSPGSSSSIVKTPDHLSEILKLTDSLLPSAHAPDAMEASSADAALSEIFASSPEVIAKFGNDLLPVLLQVHNVTGSQPVRAKILLIWSKVVKIIEKQAFQPIAKKLRISSLLGPLLHSSQDEIVVQAMGLVEALMDKLPGVFTSAFVEEGVVHAIAHLASPELDCGLAGEAVRRSSRLLELRRAEQSDSASDTASQNLSPERQDAMARAQTFINTHFAGFSAHQDTAGIVRVKAMTEKLQNPDICQAALVDLLQMTGGGTEGLSTFEFLRSRVVQSLNEFLFVGESGAIDDEAAATCLANTRLLVKTGLSHATLSGSSPLQGLVHKLRDAVAACEAFPVRHVIQRSIRNLGPSSRTGSEEAKLQNTRLASLGQPLRLKLERHATETELKELPQSQVLVEPLVVMHALEEYLWPKVRPSHEKKTEPQPQEEAGEPSTSSRQNQASNKSRSSVLRRAKCRTSPKPPEHSPDSESMSCSHDESEEGGGGFPEEDLFLDEEDDGLDEELSDIEDYDDDEEDEIEGLSHVHSLGESEDVDEMEDGDGPSDQRNYAQRLNKPRASEIEFCIGDIVIKPQATIFQAIRENIALKIGYEEEVDCKAEKLANFRHKWEETHTITYRRRTSKGERSVEELTKQGKALRVNLLDKWDVVLTTLQRVTIPEELDIDEDLKQLLVLLKMLDTINSIAHRFHQSTDVVRQLSRSEFVSSKLATKLSQQIHDPLTMCSSSSPSWTTHLVTSCKFLFPFELRRKFFYCKLGVPRTLLYFNKEYEAAGERKETLRVERGDQEVRLSQLKSNKVRVSRSKIFSSAMTIMGMYAHNTNEILEVHYYNESGVGEGPTLEFYTLMSQELQKRNLCMWRDERELGSETKGRSGKHDYVNASKGLFPRPYPPGKVPDAVLRSFVFMGKAIARSLVDGRLMDLNINPLFFHLLRGEPIDMTDIQIIDPHLSASLEKLQAAREMHHSGRPILLDGVWLADLCLPFTLPGYDDYPLTTEENTPEVVDDRNLQTYIDSVVAATLSEGIEAQVAAFKEGFESVLSVKMLEMFYNDELDLLLRGTQGCWTVEELSECVNFSHGYSPLCDQARWFLEILSELDDEQRRSFLQFVTGSPRLPPGGIAALSPKLTVVQRLNNKEGASENDLPSVATCVNFLKLPKYGSKEVMKQRLVIAFNEGQYAFDLS